MIFCNHLYQGAGNLYLFACKCQICVPIAPSTIRRNIIISGVVAASPDGGFRSDGKHGSMYIYAREE